MHPKLQQLPPDAPVESARSRALGRSASHLAIRRGAIVATRHQGRASVSGLGRSMSASRNLVDATTPLDARTITKDGESMVLVMSDEFNVDVSNYTDKVAWNSSVAEPDVKWTASNTLSFDAFGDSFMHPGMLEARDGVLHVTQRHHRAERVQFCRGRFGYVRGGVVVDGSRQIT